MAKKSPRVPTYSFLYFQLHAPLPARRDQWLVHGWVDNGHRYRLVAQITAESELHAMALLQEHTWHHQPGVTLMVSPSALRPKAYGDVLLCQDSLLHWYPKMMQGETLVELPQVQQISSYERQSQQKAVLAVAWSPDGRYYAACGRMGIVSVYTRFSKRDPHYETRSAYAQALAWSPDGSYIATGDSCDAVHIWEPAVMHGLHGSKADVGRVLICRERRHADLYQGVYALAFSPDSRYVASGNHFGELHIWDVRTGECVFVDRTQNEGSVVQAVAWSKDGTRLATATDGGRVALWNWTAEGGSTATCECTFFLSMNTAREDSVRSLAFSPDGTQLVIGGGESHILTLCDGFTDPWSGYQQWTIPLSLYSDEMGVGSVAFSPDGRYAVAGCVDGSVQVVHLEQGQEHIYSFFEHRQAVNAVAWSPDGSTILSGSDDSSVRLWDARVALEQGEESASWTS
jgi:WD40 repeat protein